MNATVIFRYRNTPDRLPGLLAILNHIKDNKQLEIILSVMDNDVQVPFGKKIFSQGQFENSLANNIGASHASTNIFIFQDADIIFPNNFYDEMIKSLNNGEAEAIRIGERCVNYFKHTITPSQLLEFSESGGNGPCSRNAPGACLAITRQAFIRIGGWCELFKVYGWEDCYMRYKVQNMCNYKSLNKTTVHLPHHENYQIGQQPQNSELYYEILRSLQSCVDRDHKFLVDKYPTLRPQ